MLTKLRLEQQREAVQGFDAKYSLQLHRNKDEAGKIRINSNPI